MDYDDNVIMMKTTMVAMPMMKVMRFLLMMTIEVIRRSHDDTEKYRITNPAIMIVMTIIEMCRIKLTWTMPVISTLRYASTPIWSTIR